jgi:hypothetical protein
MFLEIDWKKLIISAFFSIIVFILLLVLLPIKYITHTGCEVSNPDFYPPEGQYGSGLTCMISKTYITKSTQYNYLIWIIGSLLVGNYNYFRNKKIDIKNLVIVNIFLIIFAVIFVILILAMIIILNYLEQNIK